MKSSAKKIELASVDDLFSTEEGRQDAKLEKIQEIPLSELHPFKNHPFKVKDDEAMMETADSIKQYGVLVPAIARPDPEGGYELVALRTEFHIGRIKGAVKNGRHGNCVVFWIIWQQHRQRNTRMGAPRFSYRLRCHPVKISIMTHKKICHAICRNMGFNRCQ